MSFQAINGLEHAVFGPINRDEVDAWLVAHIKARLSLGVARVLFRSGRLAPVYGLLLDNGDGVVVKVHRDPVDRAHLVAASACQEVLVKAGFPCPVPLDGPAVTAGRTAMVESLLDVGGAADAHDGPIRAAMARSLALQVQILASVPELVAATRPPAWAVYQSGPWPQPHDPIFDFTSTPAEYQWLDALAQAAAATLRGSDQAHVGAHGDWVSQNLRFTGGELVAAYDWDSVMSDAEPVIAGLAAGAFTDDNLIGAAAPAPDDVCAFLGDYDQARGRRSSGPEQALAAAAATWVQAFNARCQVAAQAGGFWDRPSPGSPLHMLERYGHQYLQVRW